MYSYNDYREYELSHHGILGQKWGKRNGPPYPIDAGDHSASEKKAGWRKSLEQNVRINKRISNAQKAAGLEKRIDKLERKTQTESRQAKIDKLTARRNEKISDLSEDEIELGRKYLQREELLNTTSLAGMIIAGTPGMLVANLGASVVYGLSKEGKATNELAKQVIKDNREKMNNAEQTASKVYKDYEDFKVERSNAAKNISSTEEYRNEVAKRFNKSSKTDEDLRDIASDVMSDKYSSTKAYKKGSDLRETLREGVDYSHTSNKDVSKLNNAYHDIYEPKWTDEELGLSNFKR